MRGNSISGKKIPDRACALRWNVHCLLHSRKQRERKREREREKKEREEKERENERVCLYAKVPFERLPLSRARIQAYTRGFREKVFLFAHVLRHVYLQYKSIIYSRSISVNRLIDIYLHWVS